jgi:hypothetical protein
LAFLIDLVTSDENPWRIGVKGKCLLQHRVNVMADGISKRPISPGKIFLIALAAVAIFAAISVYVPLGSPITLP